MSEATLRDLGERRIISELLYPRYSGNVENYGDDCASFAPTAAQRVVMTTDPCPHPMANILGFSDYYYWGWLLSTINLSDLAAAGAKPTGLLTSLILQSDMRIQSFERLLDGIDGCCSSAGTCVVGGNLREGPQISLSGTAIGVCDTPPMSRSGAEVNDCVLVIGDLGDFWAGYFAVTRQLSLPSRYRDMLLKNILTPSPKVALGINLRRSGLMHACLDNSDGLYPSLLALSSANRLGVRVDFSQAYFPEHVSVVARQLAIDPVRFALGWGDWQLIGAAPASNVPLIQTICSQDGLQAFPVGFFHDDDYDVSIIRNGRCGPLMRLDSQRFTAASWFETGVEAYARFMLDADLMTEGVG